MMLTACLVGLAALCGQVDGQTPEDNGEAGKKARLLELFLEEARDYSLYRDQGGEEKLELQEKPVYVWTNPLVANGQFGAVYVWTWQGRPEAVGSIFVYNFAGTGRFGLMHEFHSLSEATLQTTRNKPHETRWTPEAGLMREALQDERPPAKSPAARLAQMRALARAFAIHSISPKGERWELRLLPQPLYRYNVGGPTVIDGALFSFVTSAGTDPELMILIEARQTADGPRWHYAPVRFTGFDLFVDFKGRQVWKSFNAEIKGKGHNLVHTYHVYRDRFIEREVVEKSDPAAAE
jgi:hypothetical protein